MNKQIFDAEFLNFAEDVSAVWQACVSGKKFPVELFSQHKTYTLTIQGGTDHRWNGGFRVSSETGRIEVAYGYLKSNEAFTGNFIFYQMAWGRAMFVLKQEREADEAATKLYCSLHKPVKELIRGIAEAYGAYPERNKERIEKIIELLKTIIPSKPLTAMKYTKKPVTIEAVLWDGKQVSEVTPWISQALNTKWGEGSIMRTGDVIEIYTLEGIVRANPGDYIIRGVKGELYPCKPDIFEATYSKEGEETALQKLTKFQEEVGYVKGPINPVALLGLFGEAGEVLNEVFLIDNSEDQIKAEDLKTIAVEAAEKIDLFKKTIRDHNLNAPTCKIQNPDSDFFDTELADVFYYLHALAKNRGLSLEDLAAMSLKKIGDKKLKKDNAGEN